MTNDATAVLHALRDMKVMTASAEHKGMVDLHALGLVWAQRRGRQWFWRLTPQGLAKAEEMFGK